MTVHRPVVIITIAIVVIVLGAAILGCGVKKSPIPPQSVAPAAIVDFTYTRDGDQVTLTWSIPKGEAAGSAGLWGFIVYRAVSSADAPACDDCPMLFRRIAQIDLDRLLVDQPDRKEAAFTQVIEPGYQYVYKVAALSKDGQQGGDSNRVVIK